MQKQAALIIIFNHRYDKNIPVLEAMYGNRFSHLFFLVPFYDGDKPNVIPVYENSLYFQGYLAQGAKYFLKEAFQHYLFIGDDLILHPSINENNYQEHFHLRDDSAFIPEIFSVHDLHNNNTLRFIPQTRNGKTKLYWWRLMDLARYRHWTEGVESGREMPDYAEAEKRIREHGYTIQPLKFSDLYGYLPSSFANKKNRKDALKYLYWLREYKREYPLAYPVVASYSDIVIVPSSGIKKFIHYCGVFAANRLFVELAIPTALLLACKKVNTEPMIGKRGNIYWTYTDGEATAYAEAMQPYKSDLNILLNNFPSGKLYIHPIKLSKWKTATS